LAIVLDGGKELLNDGAMFPTVTRVNPTGARSALADSADAQMLQKLVSWQYVDISSQIGFSYSEERECLPTTVIVNASQQGKGEADVCLSHI
jgi:hypothetical protein